MTCTQICYASEFGSMDGVLARRDDNFGEFLPTRVETRLKTGYFDLNNGKPIVHLTSGKRVLTFDTDSISIGRTELQFDWSPQAVMQIVDLLVENAELRQAALDLRDAILFTPLQYVGESGHVLPNALAEGISASLVPYVQMTVTPRKSICTEALKVEQIVERITEIRQKIRTAAEMMEECHRNCAERHPDQGNILEKIAAAAARVACGAGCLIKAFVDVVVGFFEVVTEIVREVVTRVVVCVNPPPKHIAVPFEGKFTDVGSRAVSGIDNLPKDANPTPDDFKKLAELIKSFGDLSEPAECILNATWTVRDLRDLGYQGVGDTFPISFSVCFDEECVKKLLKAGPKAIAAAVAEIGQFVKAMEEDLKVKGLVGVGGSVVGGGLVATFSLAFALKILAVAVVAIGYQALAIFGQIWILKALEKTKNGVCLNHPTVIVGLAGILFGPLGLISGGVALLNTPFIVTERKIA